MIKYKLHAVIPTTQYGNLQPEIELEGEDKDALHKEASSFIEEIWKTYGSSQLVKNTTEGTKVTSFTGEELIYNDTLHKYYDMHGNKLLSGSAYADKNSPKFDLEMMLPKVAKSWGVKEDDLNQLWKLNANVSTEYGTSIHTALEIWHKYNAMGSKIQSEKGEEFNYVLPKNKHIRDIVLSFDKSYGSSAEVEILISDVKRGMAGQIDRLEIIDASKKICRVGDYKTNNEIDKKKLDKYQHQLSFYAQILIAHGWTVQGLDIFHYDGLVWNKIELEVLDLIVK
jgi:hypothetical protein